MTSPEQADVEAEQRLSALLIEALGARHPALDDLARLIFARKERDRLAAVALHHEQDHPKCIPPPKMTIAGEGPDRGHWWSEDQVREIVRSFGRSASDAHLRSQPPTSAEAGE
jgi:hypothetical protein